MYVRERMFIINIVTDYILVFIYTHVHCYISITATSLHSVAYMYKGPKLKLAGELDAASVGEDAGRPAIKEPGPASLAPSLFNY